MRIVSLLPSATEIAASLGLFEQIVGVSHECDYPSAARGLPVLTSSILDHGLSPADIDTAVSAASLERQPLYAVDGALLTALKPDLILTQGVCAVCAVTPKTVSDSLTFARLEASCTAPVLSLTGVDYAGIKDDIRAVAVACGVPDRAEALIADLDARWTTIRSSSEQTPRVLMLEWPDPPWSGGHWVPEQVTAAGGVEPFSTPGSPSRRLTWAQIIEADPDVIIASACGFDLQTNLRHITEVIATNPEVAALRAVKSGQVWAADANAFFSRPAPRVVDGAELLAAILSGGEVDPTRALRLSE
ncbi:MAG: iron complex transport system substrate-binding protein [Myxococcota bacterium]|jgi:iron complex transport system substrate-binding protein